MKVATSTSLSGLPSTAVCPWASVTVVPGGRHGDVGDDDRATRDGDRAPPDVLDVDGDRVRARGWCRCAPLDAELARRPSATIVAAVVRRAVAPVDRRAR